MGRFPSGAMVGYVAGVEDADGTNTFDNNGGSNYVFSVTNGDATTWIGGIYHWPTNGALTSDTNLTLNLFASPSQTLVNAFADYSVNSWIWERVPLDFWQMDGSNEWWRAEIGLLPPGSTLWYAFDAEDGTGAIHIRPTNGLPYSATVSGSFADSDEDGLPDDWEDFWFGGLTNATASGNPDGDGLSSLPMDNWMEYVAGTDPGTSNALGEIAVLWKPSVPLQGGAMEISAASDVFDGLALSSITASFSDGGSAALGTDGAGRFQNTVLLSETSAVCKITSLSGGGETDDNRGVGWNVPIQLLGEEETADTDGDGMPDAWEMANGLNPLVDDAGDDPDLDELTNLEEYLTNTDPNNADTDGDGMPDGWEINSGLNPRSDLIAEGMAAWWRFEEGTGGTASNSVSTNYPGSLQNMDSSNWTNGPLGGALSFDGTDDYVAVQQGTPIVSGCAFTVAGLVYLKSDYGENYPTLVSDSELRLDDFSVAVGGIPGGWFGGTVTGSGTTNASTDGNANWSVPSSGNHQQRALFGGSGSANSTARQRNSSITKPITMGAAATNRPQEWAFNASYDSSDSTGSSDQNRWRVWLWANSTNISSASGYAVEYGEDGSNDTVRLFRMNNGAKVTPAIISGASVQAGDVQFSVRVRRSVGGVWQMWSLSNTSASNAFPVSDPTTVTNNPQQGTNNTTAVEGTGSVGFQVFINTSASSSRNLALDDLSVNGQITGFNLRHRDAINGGSGDSTNTTYATVSNSVRPYLDCWQTVAFSCDGTNSRLYVAGNPATNVPARFAAALQSQLLIGRDHSETTNSHLRGAIDDLRIYTRALSDTEVGDLYDRLGDADGDGQDNYQEYQAGTDPNNAASFPAAISGSIAYSGSQTGFIWVVASPSSDGFPTNRSVKISSPGAFTLPGVPTLDHYWLKAFRDANGEGAISPCEARGSYLANPVYLTNAVGGIDITLSDDTNAPTLSGVPAVVAVEHGNIPTPPDVTASDSYEGSVPVTFSQTTNTLPDFQLYAGSLAQGLNGCLLTGFTNSLVGYGSISHETFSGFAVSPYTALAATLDDITCVIQHLDDDGTLDGVIRNFQVEDPVSQGGATGAGAGIDENSGSTTNRNRFVFTFDSPVGFVGLDALDLESSPAGTLATLCAYDAEFNLLCSTNIIYPNNENGDGQIHFIGLTSDKANIGILTVTVGDTSGDGNSQHLAFDNLRFGTAAAADYEILRVWSAADSCGNSIAATQVIAVVEIGGPPIPDFPDYGPLDPPVWINELHYDNAGVDTNEGVEVAGWADIPLSDYQLVFYSGENGKVYKTVPLSGVMDDEGCGVGTLWFPIPGIQNGPTDGLALVKDELVVKQFLSYEGTLVASNGPAVGLASTPIAVAESATTTPGKSLQLQGEGYDYDAFTWQGPANATPGSANLAQIFPCPQPPGPRHLRSATNVIEIVGLFHVSNTMEVVIASTNNAGSIPVDLFSCDVGGTNGTFQGLDSFWSLAATNLILEGTNPVTFTDTGQLGRPQPSAVSNRFYAAAKRADYDGDGLTDGEEYFVYHTKPGMADTDGDGMPDGWELQYTLDPLDDGTIDPQNGAEGDLDGDGFNNALEYELEAPANNPAWNGAELAYRLTHANTVTNSRSITTNLIGLRVVVDDSKNCGGTNNQRQIKVDTLDVPDMLAWGYFIDITVNGAVEDKDDYYDQVHIRAFTNTYYFEGSDNQNLCPYMANKSVTRSVLILENSTVELEYDTMSYMYHVGAYAEITAATEIGYIKSETVAEYPVNRARTEVGVAEEVIIKIQPDPGGVTWSVSGGGSLTEMSGEETRFIAPSNASTCPVTINFSGHSITKNFGVVEPAGVVAATISSRASYPVGEAGAGMWLAPVVIGPTNVSFYQVEMTEVGQNATNCIGYFLWVNPPPPHIPKDWVPLTPENYWADEATIREPHVAPPWSNGGRFEWPIPAQWRIGATGSTNTMPGWNQVFDLDADGTVTIHKFGKWVERTVNNAITNN